MAYDEQSFQNSISELKEALADSESTLNSNLTGISEALKTLNDNMSKLAEHQVSDMSNRQSFFGNLLGFKLDRDKAQQHHEKEVGTEHDTNKKSMDQAAKHEEQRNIDQDKIVENTSEQHKEGMSVFNSIQMHSIKQLTLMGELVGITNDMRLGVHGIRGAMGAPMAMVDEITAHGDMMVEAITESMQIDGMKLEQMMSQKIELPKTMLDTSNWGTVQLNDPTSPPGTNTGQPAGKTSAEVEESRDKDKEGKKTNKFLQSMTDSLKKMRDSALKVAKGGLIAALTALGLVTLIRLFQSDAWKTFADGAASVINWLMNDAGIFTKVATMLGLLVLAFKPLLLWKGAKALAKGVKALVTKTGRAGIADKVGGIKDKVGGVFGKKTAGSMPVPKMQESPLGGAKPPAGTSKMGGWTKSLARGSRNIGAAMKSIGKGAGGFFMGLFKGIATGLKFLGNPKVLLGAAALGILSAGVWVFSKAMKAFTGVSWKAVGVGITTVLGFGALAALAGVMSPLLFAGALAIGAVGLALIPFAAAAKIAEGPLEKFGNIFKQLAKVPFQNLALAGPALMAMAAGFVALSAGGLLSGIADAFTNFFSSDPVKKLERIAKAAPGVDLMGRAFKSFLFGVFNFIKFIKGPQLDLVIEAIQRISKAFDRKAIRPAAALGKMFMYMSKVNWDKVNIGNMTLGTLDDNTRKNWIEIFDNLGSFGSIMGNSLDDLSEMFDKLSKTEVGHLDWTKLTLKPLKKSDVDGYLKVIDKLIELARVSKSGATFVLGDQRGTIVSGQGAQYKKATTTIRKTQIGGVQPPPPTGRRIPATPLIPEGDLDQLKIDEGYRKSVYLDTVGKKTIGYGFNLERGGAQAALEEAGINKSLEDLKSGKSTLSKAEASKLMQAEYGKFQAAAQRFADKGAEGTWKSLTKDRQRVLTNMAYNMGEGGLNKFKKLRGAVQSGDWQGAGVQMAQSKWAGQVGNRATRLIARMKHGGQYSTTTASDVRGEWKTPVVPPTDLDSVIEKSLTSGKTFSKEEFDKLHKKHGDFPDDTDDNLQLWSEYQLRLRKRKTEEPKKKKRTFFTADSQASRTMARIAGIKEKYEMVKSASLSPEDVELQRKIKAFKQKYSKKSGWDHRLSWSTKHAGEDAHAGGMIAEAKELGIYRRAKATGSTGGGPFDFKRTQRERDLGILKRDKSYLSNLARTQWLDFRRGGKGLITDASTKEFTERMGSADWGRQKKQIDQILMERYAKSGIKAENLGDTYKAMYTDKTENWIGTRDDKTKVIETRYEQKKGDVVNLSQYAKPTPKVLPRPLTIDPVVKKMDEQVDVVGGTGQTQVANNSGNTNVNTSQYFMGKGSKTEDPRLLASRHDF